METLASNCNDVLQEESSRKRRSVRTKFKLSKEAAEAKEWLADHWDMSQKDAADAVAEFMERFLAEKRDLLDSFVADAQSPPNEQSRKTHVLSEAAKNFFDKQSTALHLTRDQMFDASLRLTRMTVQKKHKKKVIQQHEQLVPIVEKLIDYLGEIKEEMHEIVPPDDPVADLVARHKIYWEDHICEALLDEVNTNKLNNFDF